VAANDGGIAVSFVADENPNSRATPEGLQAEIRRLEQRSTSGLWVLCLFLLLSLAAWGGFGLFPSMSEETRALLGPAPPTGLISIALVVYSFSAIILLLARLGSEPSRRAGFAHLGYLAGFYLFYHFGQQLADNFLAVFAAGLTILGFYSYQAWSYCGNRAQVLREQLEQLQRRQAFVAGSQSGAGRSLDSDDSLT